MNRLVIIGNGFDLAHGLPTSYGHFIDDFWRNFKEKVHTEEYQKFIYSDEFYEQYYSNYGEINNFKDFIHSINEFKKNNTGIYYDPHQIKLENNHSKNRIMFQFKNEFFKIINRKNLENWVDIENVYYEILKEKALPKLGLNKYSYPNDIIQLNKEFEAVKILLEKYLIEEVVKKYNFNISKSDFHDIFFPEILDDLKFDNWKEDFSKIDKEYIDELVKNGNHKFVNLRFLNFNYTPTLSIYYHFNRNLYNNSEYFIHGKLNDPNNKINFGFGDEMDEDYKSIENEHDNEYLKNFKSFQYLLNDTYKKLLDFIESEKFEVLIIGSSCGLSDRTLLNTIFEHENCRLIKVFLLSMAR